MLRISVLIFGVLWAAPGAAEAQQVRTTVSGYVFCMSLENFREQSRLRASGDQAAWRKYMENQANGCGLLRAGIRVHVEPVGGIRNVGIRKIRPVGETVWFFTNTEAVPG